MPTIPDEAMRGLAMGLLGLCIPLLGPLYAAHLGWRGVRRIQRNPERFVGKSIAYGGVGFGIGGLMLQAAAARKLFDLYL